MQPSACHLAIWPLLFALVATAARQSGHANEPADAGQPSGRLADTKQSGPSAPTQPAAYQLPSWFNFEAYKSLHGKQYASAALEELHKRIYLRTSLRVLEQRAHFRAGRRDSLASVDELSDLVSLQTQPLARPTSQCARGPIEPPPPPTDSTTNTRLSPQTDEQLASFWADERRPLARQPVEMPACCSYDQVYGRIIAMLRRASETRDLELSRALLAELQLKPRTQSLSPNSDPNHNSNPNSNSNSNSNSNLTSNPNSASNPARQLPESTLATRKRPEPADASRVGVSTSSSLQLAAGLEEAVREQVAEQLGSEAPLGRQLNRQLSEYFGAPVRLRARPAEIKKTI